MNSTAARITLAKTIAVLMVSSFYSMAVTNNIAAQDSTHHWKYFEIENLSEQNEETDSRYLNFLNETSLRMGLYELKAGGEDTQTPHRFDEVYYITKGRAKLAVGESNIAVRRGSIVYVKAEVSHRFFDITEDLQVLVVFSKSTPDPGAPDWKAFELEELQQKRNPDKNVWNPFLDVPTMRFGLYMLPESVGGDNTLIHQGDEINIVVGGTSTFVVDDEEFKVRPGSIFFVEKNHGHRFRQIEDDFIEILILFHK